MSLLILDRRGARLELSSKRLAIRVPDEPVRHVPIGLLDRVVVHAGTELSTQVLCALGQSNVPLLLFSPRRHRLAGVLLPPVHNDVCIRMGQFRLFSDECARMRLAQALVRARWRSLVRQQRLALAHRRGERREVAAIARALATVPENIAKAEDRASLRGMEGSLARLDFRLLALMLPPSAGFEGRNRRPPRDPANALISLGATLLVGEATIAAWQAGLDPYLGAIHEPAHGRPALACDLVEPLRPDLHAWVAELFRSQTLRARDFGRDDERGCRLGKAGRGRFYAAWAEWSRRPVRRLARYARFLARFARERS